MGRRGTGATPAVAALEAAGIAYELHRYEAGTGDFGAEAAREMARLLGVAPDRVFKTLVVATDRPPTGSRDAFAVAVLPVTEMLDLKAVAAALGCSRSAMADAAEAERLTGYTVGGVSPVGGRRRLATVLDASSGAGTPEDETVYCSAGRRGWEIGLAADDLVALTGAVVAPITRARA